MLSKEDLAKFSSEALEADDTKESFNKEVDNKKFEQYIERRKSTVDLEQYEREHRIPVEVISKGEAARPSPVENPTRGSPAMYARYASSQRAESETNVANDVKAKKVAAGKKTAEAAKKGLWQKHREQSGKNTDIYQRVAHSDCAKNLPKANKRKHKIKSGLYSIISKVALAFVEVLEVSR